MKDRLEHLRSTLKKVADADAAEHQERGIATDPVGTPGNPSQEILTPANVITFCRLLLTIAFLILFCDHVSRYAALACYAVAAGTDFLDGQVARRTQTVSWLGKIMDPIMDRVLLFTGVLGLLIVGELPVWVPVYVIGRDVYLAIGSVALQKYRVRPVDVAYIGKAATAFLMTGFCFCLLGLPELEGLGIVDAAWLPGLNASSACLGIFLVYIGVVFSVITAVHYTVEGIRIKKETLAKREGGAR